MTVYEIRDPDEARRHLLCSLWMSRCAPMDPDRVANTLRWAAELVSEGAPLPPLGFVADVGRVVAGSLRNIDAQPAAAPVELDAAIWRRYEDYVVGKLYADMSFERGVDAVQQYSGRDRDRAIAYILNAVRSRCGFGGVLLSPAVLSGLRDLKPAEVLGQARHELEQSGWNEDLVEEFEDLTNAVRMTGDLLGPEDIFELESGTALDEFGQRVALRQVLQASAYMEAGLPKQKPRATPRQYSVATNIMDEDSYPIGGFTSISNRGTMESLLRSELAYMDPQDATRPDIFDIKYVRDELLYYARDENQFLRRRLSYFFIIAPDVIKARIKDAQCSWQRVIFLLGLLTLSVRKLTDWLSHDAIHFEILFVRSASRDPLDDEHTLLQTLLREEIEKEIVKLGFVKFEELEPRLTTFARQTLCHVTMIGGDQRPPSDLPIPSFLKLEQAAPQLTLEESEVDCGEPGDLAWRQAAASLMRWWV